MADSSFGASAQVPPPAEFSFKPEEWMDWICRFWRYRKATGLDLKPGEAQVNMLIYSMGKEAENILRLLNLSDEEQENFETVKQKYQDLFIMKKNVIFERAKFKLRFQNPDEPVDNFITELYSLSQYCEFGSFKEQFIRDQIVIGILDKTLSEKLQLDATLTLEKAIAQVRQRETVKKQQELFQNKQSNNNVDRVFGNRQYGGKQQHRGKSKKTKVV